MENEIDKEKFTAAAIIIFIIAFFLRFMGINKMPLSELEASSGLQALSLFSSANHTGIVQPLYIITTSVLFKLFNSSNFTARLLPFICGMIFIVLPYFLKENIGNKKALLLSAFFAIDPALIAWSKMADGMMPAILFFYAALISFILSNDIAGIIFLSAAFASGEEFSFFILPFSIIFLIYFLCIKKNYYYCSQIKFYIKRIFSLKNCLILLLCWITLSTGFFTYPNGIGSIGEGFANAFTRKGVIGFIPLIISILIYYIVPVFLSIKEFISSQKGLFSNFEKITIILLFFFILIFQAGQNIFPWLSPIVWYISVNSFIKYFDKTPQKKNIPWGLSAIILILSYSFFYLRIAEMLNISDLNTPVSFYWNNAMRTLPLTKIQGYIFIIVLCIIIFISLVFSLIHYFQEEKIRDGFLAGFLIIWSWSLLTNAWAAAGLSHVSDLGFTRSQFVRHEPLLGQQTNVSDNTIFDMINQIGITTTGFPNRADGLIKITDDPILRWELKNNDNVIFSNIENYDDSSPAFIAIDSNQSENNPDSYLGIKLNLDSTDKWNEYTFIDWMNWIVFRKPVKNDKIITFFEKAAILGLGNNEQGE